MPEDFSKYNGENTILRKHQLAMLEILDTIVSISTKHGITCWLACGTCLGAVRHKGFIPWDDDLDIEVHISDYQNLLQILAAELPRGMVVQTNKTDWDYPAVYAKVRNENTKIYEKDGIDNNLKYRGIYIDIFPLTPMTSFSNNISASLHRSTMYALRYVFKHTKRHPVKSLIMRSTMLLLQPVYLLLKHLDKICRASELYYGYGSALPEHHSRTAIYPIRTLSFEGKNYNAPGNTHAYLTSLYGDSYMELPPPDQRRTHTTQIEFKK